MSGRLILVGRVAGAFGVKGELKVTSYTDDPLALARFEDLKREDGSPALAFTGGRAVKGAIIVRSPQVATREDAEALRGLQLYVDRDALPPPDDDEFYVVDLIGLRVESPDGAPIGKVRNVQDFGAGDLLEVEPDGGGASWFLPFTLEAVPTVRLADGVVVAVKPEETE